jgi:mono/diheme cytochrome c family protein
VQRGERGAARALRAALREHDRAACRIVLLSALHGLHELTATDVRCALHDHDPAVLTFALQHAAPFLAAGDGLLWWQLDECMAQGPPAVAWHGALALCEVLQNAAAERHHARAVAGLAALLADRKDDATLRGLVAVAAQPHQLEVLEALVARLGAFETAGGAAALRTFARAITRGRQEEAQLALFEFAAARPGSQREALLRGALDALPKPPARQGWLSFAATPRALTTIVTSGDAGAAGLATELLGAVALREARSAVPDVELTADERARFAAGQRVFAAACAACHQLDGSGMPGLAPPLRESEWVGGPAERMLRIVLGGAKGPIEVAGTVWTLEMPGQGHLSDADVAAATTYVRRSFGNRGAPVTPADVAAVREATKRRQEPWTAEELLGTK